MEDYTTTEEAHILPERREHWSWDDARAKEARRAERQIQALAADSVVQELAAERGISARELAARLCRLPAR
jgi:hypothetical protein